MIYQLPNHVMKDMTTAIFFDFCAVAGGICHILCFIPQLYHMLKTKIRGGIDMKYAFICLIGSILDLVYLVFNDAIAAWVPLVLTVSFVLLFVPLSSL
jgi:uncharacterized protein with PQ loop repeat